MSDKVGGANIITLKLILTTSRVGRVGRKTLQGVREDTPIGVVAGGLGWPTRFTLHVRSIQNPVCGNVEIALRSLHCVSIATLQ